MLQYHTFTFNAFSENTYLIWDSESLEAAIIDPGCLAYSEKQELKEKVAQLGLSVRYLLNTHCHVDHVLGNDFVKNTYKLPLHIHRYDLPVLQATEQIAEKYGFRGYVLAEADAFLDEGDVVQLGAERLEVLFLPGHAPGHLGFYHAGQGLCFSGDVLFRQSVGRTDFPLCSMDDLIASIKLKLYKLPDETIVFPGHGPTTTIGFEKVNNPYVKAK
jgi:hydroxyacylglutathione hydrolase